MGDIVSLVDKAMDRGYACGTTCPRCLEHSAFQPIILKNKSGYFLSALICIGPQCKGDGVFFRINNGYIGEAEE
jgi:hypothetical protein